MDIKRRAGNIAKAVKSGNSAAAATEFIDLILDAGINGNGPFKSADDLADEALGHSAGEIEQSVKRIIAHHRRVVGLTGFGTGFGGSATLPITIPTDVTVYYINAARMVATIAKLRGYDPRSDEVRSLIAISLVGVLGSSALTKMGITVANKATLAALKKLPGKVLIEINKKVGFRLLTKFGTKGTINLVKVVPVAGGLVGGAMNATGITAIGGYAKSNFPQLGCDDFPAGA